MPVGTDVFKLGGRAFVPMKDGTLENDFTTMDLYRGAGLAELAPIPGEVMEVFAERLLATAIHSGKVYDILGCLLLPVDMPPESWTPEVGRATAAFIKTVSAPEEKALVRSLVASLLISFLGNGPAFLKTFPKSSEKTMEGARAGETGEFAGTATGG